VGFQDRFQPIIRLWNQWIEPVESIQDAERRQESRTLAGLLLVIAFLIFFVLPVRYLVNPDPQTPRRLVSGMIGVVAILAAYYLARRGRNQAAVLLAIVLATLLIFVTTTVLDPSLGTGSLYYLTVISVFASLFLPLPKAVLVAGVHVAGMLILPLLNPAYQMKRITDGPLSFTLILTLTVLVFAWYRTQLEGKRQARLADSETRYRIISDMISDYAYSYTIDADGTLHEDWITGSFTRVTGYTWEELGQYVLFHSDDNAKASEDVKRVIRGESVTNDYCIITKSGQERWMRITRQPLWDTQQKRVTRFIAVAQDVTQGHEADEQKLRIAVQQGRLGVIGAFVQAVSHDFRTSLATIETSRYLIEKTFNSINPMKTLARLTTIRQSVGHLTQQLENLQTLSALIAPKTEMSGMNKLVNDLVLAQVPAAQRKNIALIFAPELYLSPVVADIGEVRRAINHLLLNALNYTPEGGKVNVRTYQANKMVSVEIRDSGIGIEADALEQIFDFFYRADPSRSLESGGVGLGLSIVRMIAEAHNGSVTVTSTPGQGSIFTFSLPALPAESSRAAS
jgi:two-component system, OmpR family, phosphate regulon sensor histidine kinase PhoR